MQDIIKKGKRFPVLPVVLMCILLFISGSVEQWLYRRLMVTPESLLNQYAAQDYPPDPYGCIGVAYALNPDDPNLMQWVAMAYYGAKNQKKAKAFFYAAYRKSGGRVMPPRSIGEELRMDIRYGE